MTAQTTAAFHPFAAVTYSASMRSGLERHDQISFASEDEAREFAYVIADLCWHARINPFAYLPDGEPNYAELWQRADAVERAVIRAELELARSASEAVHGVWEYHPGLLDGQMPPSYRGAANSGKMCVVELCDHRTYDRERSMCREHRPTPVQVVSTASVVASEHTSECAESSANPAGQIVFCPACFTPAVAS